MLKGSEKSESCFGVFAGIKRSTTQTQNFTGEIFEAVALQSRDIGHGNSRQHGLRHIFLYIFTLPHHVLHAGVGDSTEGNFLDAHMFACYSHLQE